MKNQELTNSSFDTTVITEYFQDVISDSHHRAIWLSASVLLLLVFTENRFRKLRPTSLYRPSNALAMCANVTHSLFRWAGYQFGRITNLVYWVQELFPFIDIKNLVFETFKIVTSPLWVVKGWYSYYTSEWTTIGHGVLSLVVLLVTAVSAMGLYENTSALPNSEYKLLMMIFSSILCGDILFYVTQRHSQHDDNVAYPNDNVTDPNDTVTDPNDTVTDPDSDAETRSIHSPE